MKSVEKLSQEIFPRLVALRRYFHSHPETAFKEFETSKKIKSELKRLKIKAATCAVTGIVASLEGLNSSPVCAIRTDMDALPIQEMTGLEFQSKYPGKMHACGHDMHMATVLGAAMILNKLKSRLAGSVRFIFQPAEEVPPGGALEMIKGGAMNPPPVKMIFGLHTDPHIPTGKIGYRDGVLMSEVLDFDLIIRGKGGHGARPHDTVDSIVVASQVINSLQTIISRSISPNSKAVLTVGRIDGGTARNVIANEVNIKGTIRGTETSTVNTVKKTLEKMLKGTCNGFGAKYKLEYVANYPALYNNSEANRILVETATELYGKKSVTELENPALGGEDFARYLKYSPGAMFRLGVRNPKVGAVHGWHSNKYNSDEKAMITGSAILAGAVIKFFEMKG
jgi:amidohydrolase